MTIGGLCIVYLDKQRLIYKRF